MHYKKINELFIYRKKINSELALLKSKINAKKGSIFNRHVYSKEQLLRSDQMNKVYAITGTMCANIDSWEEQGAISSDLRKEISNLYSDIEQRIEEIMHDIEVRQATSWEKIKSGLMAFMELIFLSMPKFLRNALTAYSIKGFLAQGE